MRNDWKYLPLGEVTSSINGLWKGKKPPLVNVGVIRNANFTKEFTLNLSNIVYLDVEERQYSTRKLQRGDLIVEKSGGSEKQPVGRTILFDLEGEYSVSNFTSILRIKDRTLILPTFLYKYLLYIYKEGYTKGMQNATTGIHNIIYDKFLSIPVPIISLAEQERIVSLLDTQFAKIDALKANAASQLQAAKDLFQSALKQLLTPQKGWEEKKLGEVSSIIGGSTPKTNDSSNWGGNNNWVTPAELNGEKYYGKTKRTISDKAAKGMQLLPIGTVLLSSRAPIGKVAITTEPMYCNQGFKNIVCSNVLYNEYVYWYILFSVPQLEALGVGATFKELSKSKTEEFSISFPSLPEQERIAARLDSISEKVKALQANYDQTINLCNDLKQSLLKSIFA